MSKLTKGLISVDLFLIVVLMSFALVTQIFLKEVLLIVAFNLGIISVIVGTNLAFNKLMNKVACRNTK